MLVTPLPEPMPVPSNVFLVAPPSPRTILKVSVVKLPLAKPVMAYVRLSVACPCKPAKLPPVNAHVVSGSASSTHMHMHLISTAG